MVIAQSNRLTVNANLAAFRVRHTKQAQTKLSAPGTQQTNNGDDLAAVQRQINVLVFASAAEIAQLKQRLLLNRGPFRQRAVVEALSGHQEG